MMTAAKMARGYPTGRSSYKPGHARMGDPTPQSDPNLFSEEDIKAEIKHLERLDKRLGQHPLRVQARMRLWREIGRRRGAE